MFQYFKDTITKKVIGRLFFKPHGKDTNFILYICQKNRKSLFVYAYLD